MTAAGERIRTITRPTAGAPPVAGALGLAADGPHAFALPASHSLGLARAAALTTGALALLLLALRFLDVAAPPDDAPRLTPPSALDRTEIDLPSLTKPVRSEIPRFHADLQVVEASPSAEPAPVVAVPSVAVPSAEPAEVGVLPPASREAAEPARPVTAPPVEAAFAGVWGPDDSACTPRTNRAGYLPAVITAQGAFAGETSCAFRNARAVSGGWSVLAACQSPKGRWTTQVRLAVTGRRLTWSSPRGTQTYVRCGDAARG